MKLGARAIDVSNVNPADLATLKASHAAVVICKATQGFTFHDKVYPAARASARKLKRPFGGYVFLSHYKSGAEQARVFLTYAKPKPGDLQPIIDTEGGGGEPGMARVAAVVDACAMEFERRGYRPLLYASTSWLSDLYRIRPGLRRLRVWQAEYPSRLPAALKARLRLRSKLGKGVSVVMWQYTSRWPVRGRGYDGSYLLADPDSFSIPKPKPKPRRKQAA